MRAHSLGLAFLSMLMIFSWGCRKDADFVKKTGSTRDLKVPAGFTWSNTKPVTVKIGLPQTGYYPLQSRISIYSGNPFAGGVQLVSGSLNSQQDFEQTLNVPAHLQSLFLVLHTSTGEQMMQQLTLSGNQLVYRFPPAKISQLKSVGIPEPDPGPGCDVCDEVISGSGQVNIGNGKTYCVTGTFDGTVNFQSWNGGGTLKVCGTANINQNISLGTNCHIVVTGSGSLTTGSISMWGNSNSVKVYANATLNINGNISTTGVLLNHGTIQVSQEAVIQSLSEPFVNLGAFTTQSKIDCNGATITNYGTISSATWLKFNNVARFENFGTAVAGTFCEFNGSTCINEGLFEIQTNRLSINGNSTFTNNGSIATLSAESGDLNINSGRVFTNNGSISVAGRFNINSSSTVFNNCKIVVQGKAEVNSGTTAFNSGYLSSAVMIQINGGAGFNLNDGSMLSTPQFVLYRTINGNGQLNTIKATTSFTMSGVQVRGAIEASTPLLNILPGTPVSQHFVNGATVVSPGNEQNFLPITACNPEGLGAVAIIDTDNDGVPDDLDAFPNDPLRAFVSWYPAENTFTTFAFEDLWPSLGDFDFNDVVVIANFRMVTNAQNQLVDVEGKFRLMAAGAGFDNGFAVAFDIAPEHVASVTGGTIASNYITTDPKGFEAGHSSQTVWIVMDAINTIYPSETFINTVPEQPYLLTDTLSMFMTLSQPQAVFGQAPFNPFIIVGGDRGKEVHLPDHAPTALANPAYFGTSDDASNSATGKYYKTGSSLPWAIEIPVTFDYPVEKADILLTHLRFADWAQSGGQLYPDWYLDRPGYRNMQNIYTRSAGK
ncbi:MAG: LruC domain-containing protein [Bacteroidetes bacterium]|nr:LruC domain-containing protein [Bacteroidota bacterium]